ncbi:MAG: trypsin-like peptidase domain-containing protein [bacterium]
MVDRKRTALLLALFLVLGVFLGWLFHSLLISRMDSAAVGSAIPHSDPPLYGGLILAAGETDVSSSRENAIVRATRIAGPAVVNISAVVSTGYYIDPLWEDFFRRFFFEYPPDRRPALGSGVIVDKRGYVLTNEHVVRNAEDIRVKLSGGEEYEARIVGINPRMDIAILKIDGAPNLPVAKLGTSSDLMIGEWVIAIGNPFGLQNTVTAGVVSATDRSLQVGDGSQRMVYEGLIQTDASINPGNSGGPLVNVLGEVVGINTAIYAQGQGLGFAIPIDKVKAIIRDYISQDTASISSVDLGITVQALTEDLARYFGLNTTHGVLVTSVKKGGPFEETGLKPQDIIVAVNDRRIEDREDFIKEVSRLLDRKESFTLAVVRDGRLYEAIVRGDISAGAQGFRADKLGISVADVSDDIARIYDLGRARGIIVTKVFGDPAARGGLREGDVIQQINNKVVRDLKDFEAMLKEIKSGDNVLIFIKRDRFTKLFVSLKAQ